MRSATDLVRTADRPLPIARCLLPIAPAKIEVTSTEERTHDLRPSHVLLPSRLAQGASGALRKTRIWTAIAPLGTASALCHYGSGRCELLCARLGLRGPRPADGQARGNVGRCGVECLHQEVGRTWCPGQ